MKTTTQAKVLVLFAGIGLSIASAKTYHITVSDHTQVAGTQLKAGDYRVKVDGTVATLTGENNKKVEATGTVQSSDQKFPGTALEVSQGTDGMNHITAIDLGGTSTKLTFSN